MFKKFDILIFYSMYIFQYIIILLLDIMNKLSELFYYIKSKMHRHKLIKTDWNDLNNTHSCDCCKTQDLTESWHCVKCNFDVCTKCMESNGKYAVKKYNTKSHPDMFLSTVYILPIFFVVGTYGIGLIVVIPYVLLALIPTLSYIVYRKLTGWNIDSNLQNWGMISIHPNKKKLAYYSKYDTGVSD